MYDWLYAWSSRVHSVLIAEILLLFSLSTVSFIRSLDPIANGALVFARLQLSIDSTSGPSAGKHVTHFLSWHQRSPQGEKTMVRGPFK
jgi:hypothetical protein